MFVAEEDQDLWVSLSFSADEEVVRATVHDLIDTPGFDERFPCVAEAFGLPWRFLTNERVVLQHTCLTRVGSDARRALRELTVEEVRGLRRLCVGGEWVVLSALGCVGAARARSWEGMPS